MIKKSIYIQWIWNNICYAGSWCFDNEFARNVIIFGIDNSLSPHSDNFKNTFLILGEGSTYSIKKVLDHQKKSLIFSLIKQTQTIV